MDKYILSLEAEFDLERLLELGIDTLGEAVSITYIDGLVGRFESIAISPLQYPEVNNIREIYSLSVFKVVTRFTLGVTEKSC